MKLWQRLTGKDTSSSGQIGEPADSVSSATAIQTSQRHALKQDAKAIRPYFDAKFYLDRYGDVAQSGMDPLDHFLKFGWKEGRDPAPHFSTTFYLEEYNDIREGGINPFVHFCLFGRAEGRAPKPPGSGSPKQAEASNEPPPAPAQPADKIKVSRKDIKITEPFFDAAYYLERYPDIAAGGIDPLEHYLTYGWREGRDPSPTFSTNYYLGTNQDIRDAGINPFLHYCQYGHKEQREGIPYYLTKVDNFRPLVSVIIPNYNHAQFLPERFRSILDQTYTNIELIVLDDCSKDDSVQVIEELIKPLEIPVVTKFNEVNSGNVFAQWQRGIEMASGDFIWICESDDTCEPDFLENIIPNFVDKSVMLTFGNIQFCDSDGKHMPGMDGFREYSEPGIWSQTTKRPAHEWFAGAFGVNNVLANVGGCVFRKGAIDQAIWDEAKTFKIAGDWFLYSHIIGGGQMCYVPQAKTYFRQHARNTSASNFNKLYYYEELWRLLNHHVAMWGIPAETRQKFIDNVSSQYRHFKMPAEFGPFEERFDSGAVLASERTGKHIILAFLGFHSGGGEVFAINLANELVNRGHFLSLLAFNMASVNEAMVANLDSRVPVYHFGDMNLRGRKDFLQAVGADVIHSHVVHCDAVFFRNMVEFPPVPYVVTLHGSYDSIGPEGHGMLFEILKGVSHWVYTADKNLKVFGGIPLDPAAVSKVRNAMPRDTAPFPQTRADLGIHEDAIVYTLVARGIQQKGWRASITAFRRLQKERPDINAHLILIGDGDRAEELTADIGENENISNLGFQSKINGIYRLSDCAIVPTRFSGESFPLCIIQAMQESTPVIATDIGEIKTMITNGDVEAGILLENKRNSEEYFGDLFTAMVDMADAEKRRVWAANAGILNILFDMQTMVQTYEDIYGKAIKRHQTLLNAAAEG